jgi:hypothetical protein
MAHQDEIRGKIESAKTPAITEADLEGYQSQFTNLVEDGI